ncbi:hypothetical protein [Saccharopolyspora phatthalungensis]|uniref:Uncharacterized protein n=1 Tax=Saccharopolyspora phatthalungensis TaxID=664693 RepID=A0A840Q337_9PSEU|nr:hypothetical protein [Saccharopolyspora phatthalungensis]MBB5154330.1 hypothetical protein [Saccharopolyspora phatthalungensis]
MATSTLIPDANQRLDWFAEPLAAVVNLFASQLPAASDDGTSDADPTPGTASDRLPPPTGVLLGGTDPIPGEPVDTSQARPAQSPAASAGTAPSSE